MAAVESHSSHFQLIEVPALPGRHGVTLGPLSGEGEFGEEANHRVSWKTSSQSFQATAVLWEQGVR